MLENVKRKKEEVCNETAKDGRKLSQGISAIEIRVEGQRSKKPTLARGWRMEKEKNNNK